ncbi:MAG: DUF29 domain-containing protein [Candidatus Tectomicrobia bacterium]|nr:DUF29 domain-containing protein [Candidatus Tectomicrobia bacterium]
MRAIHTAIDRGEVLDRLTGLEEMIHLTSKREDRELRSRLIVLMAHILRWKTQSPGRKSWRHTILTQRQEIAYLRRDAPRYTQARILEDFWEEALSEAIRRITDEMDQSPAVDTLTWDEVFEVEYDEHLSG